MILRKRDAVLEHQLLVILMVINLTLQYQEQLLIKNIELQSSTLVYLDMLDTPKLTSNLEVL